MDLSRFNADDIHELRVQMAEQYSKMTPEEARRAINEEAENTRRAIEKLRAARKAKAV
jgi:hypothetical protein